MTAAATAPGPAVPPPPLPSRAPYPPLPSAPQYMQRVLSPLQPPQPPPPPQQQHMQRTPSSGQLQHGPSSLLTTKGYMRFTSAGTIDPAKSLNPTGQQQHACMPPSSASHPGMLPSSSQYHHGGLAGSGAPPHPSSSSQQYRDGSSRGVGSSGVAQQGLIPGLGGPVSGSGTWGGGGPGRSQAHTPASIVPPPAASKYASLSSDNIGHRLLLKSGWKEGSGLGAQGKGITVPVR